MLTASFSAEEKDGVVEAGENAVHERLCRPMRRRMAIVVKEVRVMAV